MKKMLVLVSVLLLSSAAMAETWDLVDDFSSTTNPSGAWSYGYIDGGVYTNLPEFIAGTEPTGNNFAAWRNSGGDWDSKGNIQKILDGNPFELYTSYRYPGEMACGPSSTGLQTTVRWTCPTDGVYPVSLEWVGLSTKAGGTTVGCTFAVNGSVEFSEQLAGFIGRDINNYEDRHGAWQQTYSGVLTLSAGDVLDMIIDRGADQDGGADCTGMNFTVTPEPFTMALLGLGGMALLRRRR